MENLKINIQNQNTSPEGSTPPILSFHVSICEVELLILRIPVRSIPNRYHAEKHHVSWTSLYVLNICDKKSFVTE